MSNVAHFLTPWAARRGQAFVACEDVTWTYAEIAANARRVARWLRQHGTRRGDRVALLLDNGPEFICAYFGILATGAIAVSLPPALPAAEAWTQLIDSGARLVFTGTAGAATLSPGTAGAACEVVVMSSKGTCIASPALPDDDGHPIADVDVNDPAAIVYSSGTEGMPKGVLLSHGNVRFTATSKRRYMVVRESDQLLLFLPLHHCFGQNAVMNAAAASGACLVVQRRFDPAEALHAVSYDGVTMFFGVPTVFSALLDLAEPAQLAGVRYFFSAAAPLPPAIEERWLSRYGRPIHQGYGMTESSPFATYNHLERLKPGTVGQAIEGVEIRVVDPVTGARLPPHTQGEITIRGPNVMLGYWKQPDATARTVRDGWLHTGDLGRLDEDDYLTIDDRLKDIIVVGGSNVSPVEVEKALCRHPAVREAAVYGVPEPYLGEEVHAAIVLRPGHQADGAAILADIRSELAAYKVPSAVAIVDGLPKAPTGKILRRVLRDQARVSRAEPASVVPDPGLREWLNGWFASRLGTAADGVDPNRPLLDYGLNSILGVALARDLSQHLGCTVPPTLVWEQPTLQALLRACGGSSLVPAAAH